MTTTRTRPVHTYTATLVMDFPHTARTYTVQAYCKADAVAGMRCLARNDMPGFDFNGRILGGSTNGVTRVS